MTERKNCGASITRSKDSLSGKWIPLDYVGSEERQITCECGIIFNDEAGVKWQVFYL